MNRRYLLPILLLAAPLAPTLHAATTLPAVRLELGSHPRGSFDPREALGGGLDGHWQGETEKMLSPESVREMLEVGLGPVSIRLRSELAVEAWHWNPKGTWSDQKHRQGYWLSEVKPDLALPILLSYGYKLPRRGNTLDEANDDGYSMLDDGDPSTFWKSNPYLTRSYTGEADGRHPQWVVLDFGKKVPVNAITIRWGEPYAKSFRVEYATKGRVYFGGHPWNVWHPFPHGVVNGGEAGKGGEQFLQFGKKPLMVRYLRIWMTESSGTPPKGSRDPRDGMGYAIREIMAGEAGQFDFDDHVVHQSGKKQTITYASSTDPWHRAIDRDPKVEQPGIDRIFRSGITRGLPVMLPIPVFYDTPENGAGLAEYVKRAGYPVSRYELGEEPDGQRVDPRDFGALYGQAAQAIRNSMLEAVMGGPSFVTADAEPNDDIYRFDHHWWIHDFRRELARLGQSGDLKFLSFEWYPFDDVLAPEAKQLPKAYGMMQRAMARLRREHLPLVIGEFNYSVFPCRPEVDLSGALLNAETAAQFLCGGGEAVYYYGYEPNKLEQSCGSWGDHLMLLRGEGGRLIPIATFQALRMLSREWLDPQGGVHVAYQVRVRANLPDAERDLLSAFALRRPDGKRSLLMINKDPVRAITVSLKPKALGPNALRLTTYSRKEYQWVAKQQNGHPSRNHPPSTQVIPGDRPVTLPPMSISVLRSE